MSPIDDTFGVDLIDGREARLGEVPIRRVLPTKGRRTVGAWCFADHMGPADVTEEHGLDVGPHPHIGLQTVTWLLDGQVLHRDSLGSEQVIRPGQLNLMTSGSAVTHSEEATGHYRGTLEGIQLWVALPESTRHAEAAFEHHAELPRREYDGGVATVLIGDLDGTTSPARRDTDHLGVDVDLHATTTLPVHRDHEYAVVALRGAVDVDGYRIRPGALAYLGTGRDELRLEVSEPARLMLIGGPPFPERVAMWWNFVARDRDELDAAYRSWASADDRFRAVDSPLPRIPFPRPPWSRA